MRKFLISLALAGMLATGLAGCAVDGQSSSTGSNAPYDMNDIMFAQMMIPHHEQAVEMSTLAETRATDVEIVALAVLIKNAQQPEIDLMTAWLTA